MNFLDFLVKATTARILSWEPDGEAIYIKEPSSKFQGYRTEVDGFKVTMIAQPHKKWVALAIAIEKDGKKEVFTERPKVVPGTKCENVFVTFLQLQHEIEDRDLVTSLRQSLAQQLLRS